jgi:VWFA-related protein
MIPPVLRAQTPAAPVDSSTQEPTSTISVRSNLVIIPALVKTKAGAVVYTLTAKDFIATDNGVEQALTLVVLVQTGGDGADRLYQYQNLGPVLDAVVGNVPHKIAVVSFDSSPWVEQRFTTSNEAAETAINKLQPGDPGSAILDALKFSVALLRQQPPAYRRAILMITETIDHGSKVPIDDALRAIDDTNTAIYSMAFSSTKGETAAEAAKLSSSEPGPAHGCFAHDPNSNESRATQNYDCIAELLPPLRLAKMAAIVARNSLKRNTAETVAKLTGGEYFHIKDEKSLEKDLLAVSNHLPNRYVLSFRPQSPHPGFHTLELRLKNYDNLVVEARNGYWVEDDAMQSSPAAIK